MGNNNTNKYRETEWDVGGSETHSLKPYIKGIQCYYTVHSISKK